MKKSLYFLPVLAIALVGCNGAPPDADTQAQSASSDKKTAFGRSMDMAKGVETDSNIKQINQALSMAKGEDGKPPADIDAAKKSLKDYPAEMWVDGATGKALQYHPETGTVSR